MNIYENLPDYTRNMQGPNTTSHLQKSLMTITSKLTPLDFIIFFFSLSYFVQSLFVTTLIFLFSIQDKTLQAIVFMSCVLAFVFTLILLFIYFYYFSSKHFCQKYFLASALPAKEIHNLDSLQIISGSNCSDSWGRKEVAAEEE